MPSGCFCQPGAMEVSSFGCGISCIVLFFPSCWHNLTYRLQSLVWGSCLPVYFHSSVDPAQYRLFWTWNPITSPKAGKVWKQIEESKHREASQQGPSDFSAHRQDSEQEAGWRQGKDTCLGPTALILHRLALLWDVEFRNSDIPGPVHLFTSEKHLKSREGSLMVDPY